MRRVDSLEKTDAGRDWGQEEKGTTEDEMAGWHHRLNGREFEWTPGVVDGQDGLACSERFMGSQRVGHNWTTELNWTELNWRTADRGTLQTCQVIGIRSAVGTGEHIFYWNLLDTWFRIKGPYLSFGPSANAISPLTSSYYFFSGFLFIRRQNQLEYLSALRHRGFIRHNTQKCWKHFFFFSNTPVF